MIAGSFGSVANAWWSAWGPLATEKVFPNWLLVGMALRGWALALRGSCAEGLALLEQAVGQGERPPVHLAGVTVRYDPRARAGRRIKAIALTGERTLRPEETYTLVTDAETAAGAAGLSGLAARRAERLGVLDVEAVAGYLRRLAQPVEIESAPAFLSTRR